MIIKYKSRNTPIGYFWGLLMVTFTIWLSYPSLKEGRYLGLILFGCLSVVVWYFTFLFPAYQIDGKTFQGRSINGKIDIDITTIRKIETYTHFWGIGIFSPMQKGLLIHYGNFQDVFVNPKDQVDFIKQLCAINPSIELVGKIN